MRITEWLASALQDARYGLRQLRKTPVLALAVGILAGAADSNNREFSPYEGTISSDRYFNLARGHGQWHAEFGPYSQAFADCIGDV